MTVTRGLFLGGGVALVLAIALWWHATRVVPLVWQGYAEADYVKVGPVGEGQLTRLFVERGHQVTVEQHA